MTLKNDDKTETDGFTDLYRSEEFDFNLILAEELGDGFVEYRRLWDRAATFEFVPDYPIHIDFELNHSCNLKCPMCPYGIPDTGVKNIGKRSWFSFEKFKALIDEGVDLGLKSIGVNWLNEPLIRSDLPDFVDYARKKGIIDVFIHTNAMLLSREMAERLIDAGLTRMIVSIDATTGETYDKVRIGGKLETVHENIFSFLELRKKKNSRLPILSTAFCQMEENDGELETFEAFWKGHVDYLTVQNFINMENVRGKKSSSDMKGEHPEFMCTHPFKRAVVRYDGTFLPCCATGYAPRIPVGNIFKTGIKELWLSGKIKQLRELHSRGEYYKNHVCRSCVLGCTGLAKNNS